MNIPYGKQSILQEDIDSVINVLKSNFLTQGPVVTKFEEDFARQVGSKFAVAFSNATTALHSSYLVLNRDCNKKVITTPITFAASSNCVLYGGGKVEFVDIDPHTLNIDLNRIEDALKKNASHYQGIIPVDFGGLPVEVVEIKSLAEKYGLWIIEDGCHAIGAKYKDNQSNMICTGASIHSDITSFSFHPVKHIATGEGGMLTTNDESIYKKLIKIRSHGMEKNPENFRYKNDGGWYHEMQELGYNYRMSDINAALGISQLRRLETNINCRKNIADKYKKALKNLPIKFQEFNSSSFEHSYHLFIIQTSQRKKMYDYLKSHNIFCQVHYIPVYKHPYYQENGFKNTLCPNAEKYYEMALSLPMFHSISDIEVDFVIEKIISFFNEK